MDQQHKISDLPGTASAYNDRVAHLYSDSITNVVPGQVIINPNAWFLPNGYSYSPLNCEHHGLDRILNNNPGLKWYRVKDIKEFMSKNFKITNYNCSVFDPHPTRDKDEIIRHPDRTVMHNMIDIRTSMLNAITKKLRSGNPAFAALSSIESITADEVKASVSNDISKFSYSIHALCGRNCYTQTNGKVWFKCMFPYLNDLYTSGWMLAGKSWDYYVSPEVLTGPTQTHLPDPFKHRMSFGR